MYAPWTLSGPSKMGLFEVEAGGIFPPAVFFSAKKIQLGEFNLRSLPRCGVMSKHNKRRLKRSCVSISTLLCRVRLHQYVAKGSNENSEAMSGHLHIYSFWSATYCMFLSYVFYLLEFLAHHARSIHPRKPTAGHPKKMVGKGNSLKKITIFWYQFVRCSGVTQQKQLQLRKLT